MEIRSLKLFSRTKLQRGWLFGVLIMLALLAFEMFNYSTTEYSLRDLLGELRFMGIPWATILAIAFCGIDFAGIARLFTPEQGADEPTEVWYLFGAWVLAAIMNAILTWWGVSIAIASHGALGNEVIERGLLLKIVPVFVAIMVFLIRILLIGTFSVAGERLFSQAERRAVSRTSAYRPAQLHPSTPVRSLTQPKGAPSFRPAPKTMDQQPSFGRPEPTYHPISMSGSAPIGNPQILREP